MSDDLKVPSLIDDNGLDERENAFLDVLFDVCSGNVRNAMDEVGYPKGASTHSVTRKLAKHIQQRSKEFLLSQSANAAVYLVNVLRDPGAVGVKAGLTAAKDILDRASVVKDEGPQTIEVRNMFILPAKEYPIEIDHE